MTNEYARRAATRRESADPFVAGLQLLAASLRLRALGVTAPAGLAIPGVP